MPQKKIVNLSKAVFKMPAGKYYVGDPCYVFSHDTTSWDELLEQSKYFDFRRETPHQQLPGHGGNAILFKGHPIAGFDTEYGDGTYKGTDGFNYGVDAGLLGVVAEALIERPMAEVHRLGTIVEFPEDFICSRDDDGTITLGHIVIKTGDDADYDEDDN